MGATPPNEDALLLLPLQQDGVGAPVPPFADVREGPAFRQRDCRTPVGDAQRLELLGLFGAQLVPLVRTEECAALGEGPQQLVHVTDERRVHLFRAGDRPVVASPLH